MKHDFQQSAKPSILAVARKKLQCRAGDSFAEVLVAILIAALAASLLATMVTVSADVTMTNETRLTALHTAESDLALSTAGTSVDVAITCASFTGAPTDVTVKATLYSADNFTRYEAKAGTNG